MQGVKNADAPLEYGLPQCLARAPIIQVLVRIARTQGNHLYARYFCNGIERENRDPHTGAGQSAGPLSAVGIGGLAQYSNM